MIASLIVLFSLLIFWGVSLQNVIRHRGTDSMRESSENPMSPSFTIALIGTIFLFAESLVFAYLGINGAILSAIGSLFVPSSALKIFGTIFYGSGALLHAWSVRVRGRHAVSWAMSSGHRIISDAPYSIVRHPSYLGYMLMIVGMTLIWGNAVTLVPWMAIPGYYFVSFYEEAMLIEQFGEEYREYMRRVGAFIPRTEGLWEAQVEK